MDIEDLGYSSIQAKLNLAGKSNIAVSTVGRVVNVTHAPGGTLAVISVGDKAFMMPIDNTQVGEMRRLQGLPVTVTITPTNFSRGITGMGNHLLNRGRG